MNNSVISSFLLIFVFLSNGQPGHRVFADEPSAIWGQTIAAQPFDSQSFREVQIPEWLHDIPGCGYTLSVMSSEQRAEAARHGVRLSEMGFVDPFYAYYDSKLLKRRNPHVVPGQLQKDIAEYQALGVRILGVYPPCLQSEVYELHPEWRRIATNTTEIPETDMQKFPHGGMLCLLGPYGDFFIEVLAEILTQFPDVDAFSFDGLHYGGVCYCNHCRQSYRKDTGQEIPNTDMNDAEFRKYQHWADRRMEDLVRRMQTRLKGIKPDVALVTWSTNAGRFGHFLSIPRNMPARMNLLLDAPDQEFWMDESNRGSTIVPAFANACMWAYTNHRVAFSEPYLMSHGNPYGNDSFPGHEVLSRMLLAVTWGTSPSIAVKQPQRLQESVYHCMYEIQRRREWLSRKRPEPWAALVMSDNTRNFYGRSAGQVEERYMASVFGAFRAVVEEHLPTNVISDWNLNPQDLATYQVLILPDTACLDQSQADAIREFVRNGGGLVATQDTSLFDEFGTPRENFALADIFGVDYRGLVTSSPALPATIDENFAKSIGPDYWEKRRNVFDLQLKTDSFLKQGSIKAYVGEEPVTFKGPAVNVSVQGNAAETLAVLRVKGEAGAVDSPALTARQFGKGRVVYIAAGLDSAYYLYPYPYQRLILREAITWAAAESPPIQVRAPMCVHSTVMRQKNPLGGERLIVHLLNDVNTTADHALPADDVPLREETIPIHGIRVDIRKQYTVTRAMLQPEDIELPLEKTAHGVQVTVPVLSHHSMVILDLDSDKRTPEETQKQNYLRR